MTQSDRILAERAKKGDREAFRQLLEAHYTMVYRVAWRFTGHSQDAEDIAQEVCMVLVDKIDSFKGNSSFSTWLYRIVVNACHDLHKKRKNHRSLEQRYVEFEENEVASQKETNEQIVILYRAIAELEESLRDTALLVLAEELSHAEAGEALGCAESTVSWRMHEVRKQLREVIGDEHG